ncbi:MAG TPA: hypothetical protein VE972_10295 [Conexibacter sp.]|nr:hypothetical protein [Conexibacter sp.]
MALAAVAIPTAGCGGSGGGGASNAANVQPAPPSAQLAAAEHPAIGDFPAPQGRTLRKLAGTLLAGPNVALATTAYAPGRNRLAFGLVGADGSFIYGKTAIYIARTPDGRAQGPFLAPADSLQVRPPFRSHTTDPGDVKAVYYANVDLPGEGRWYVLAITRAGAQLVGGTNVVDVGRSGAGIVAVGDPAPRIDTPTLASVGGDAAKIDTRTPPDTMHGVSLKNVLGKRPVMLLFSTPALCQSRVCGPVTDIAEQLKTVYGDKVAFIHNEVYVDNDPNKGLRPQLKAFGLSSEPWLFAIDRHGRVAARLEGAFGFDEFKAAVAAAQRG